MTPGDRGQAANVEEALAESVRDPRLLQAGLALVEGQLAVLFDVNGATGNTIQCTESVCGDPDGVTAIGPKIYTYVIRPRMIGLRVGTKF